MKNKLIKYLRYNALPTAVAVMLVPITIMELKPAVTVSADCEPEVSVFHIEDTGYIGVERCVEVEEFEYSEVVLDLSYGSFRMPVEEWLLIESEGLSIPEGQGVCNSDCITYMSYTAVTCKVSDQYRLLNDDTCYTNKETGFRMVDGRICVAVGTGYASRIGTKIDVVMKNGAVVPCILGDVKADCDTDATNRYQVVDGSVLEVIIDKDYFGGISTYPIELEGRIDKIVIVED